MPQLRFATSWPLREPDLSRLPKLKLIAVAATGVDDIDLSYCKSRGIAVCYTRIGRAGWVNRDAGLVAERKHATTTREGRTKVGEVLRLSDVLTLHCPLTEETMNLIDAAEFQDEA